MSLQVQLYEVCDHCGGTGKEVIQFDKLVSCHMCVGQGHASRMPIGEAVEPKPDSLRAWFKMVREKMTVEKE